MNKNLSCGDWRLEREIGHGAYGVVYYAANSKGELAAVKVCLRETIGEERYERELRGARLYSAIPPQEGLVRMLELAEEPWGFFAVMELADDEFGQGVSGGRAYRPKTLASVIDGEKALPLNVSVKLGIALAKGLETLQRHHLLHRDIKPGNVIYVRGRPVLSDPGLVVEESQAVSLVGTPGYVPPENFTDAAGDIYSLGLTLKAASFGRKIEDLDKGPALEADTGAKFFPAWWRILNKATDPTPSCRYRSAKALLKELKSLHFRMALPPVGGLLATVAIIGLLAAIYFAATARYKIFMREKSEREYIEEQKLEVARSIEDMRKGLLEMANVQKLNEESAQNDAVWSSFSGSYFCRTDESHRQRLARVAERDSASAAKMRNILGQMLEVDKKGAENNARIKTLREKAKSGQDAADCYNQAELLSMENEKLVKAWLSLLERFTLIEDSVKQNQ